MRRRRYTREEIAQVAHAANTGLQNVDGDPAPSLPWPAEPDEIRESTMAGVAAVLAGATAEELHEEWRRDKAARGWVHGPVKDPAAKTHPCLVPYRDLPPEQQVKDAVFRAIVLAMSGGAGCAPPNDGAHSAEP